jgi:hypothetical protein
MGPTHYIYKYILCVCAGTRATFMKSFVALSAPGPCTAFECTGENIATARRAAVTRVRCGTNLNCIFKVGAVFSHPYQQLKFFGQSLLDWILK